MSYPNAVPLEVDSVINTVLARYSRGVDRRDWDLVRSAFHSDAHDDHGSFRGSVDDMIEWMTSRHEQIEGSLHVLGQSTRQMATPDLVTSETYCVVYQQYKVSHVNETLGTAVPASAVPQGDDPVTAVQVQVRCRYLDEITRVNHLWRISRRRVIYESRALEHGLPIPSGSGGTRGPDDPSYRVLPVP